MAIIRRTDMYRLAGGGSLAPENITRRRRFRWTGEHRPPRAGEWFLSGNPIEAYYAPHDAGNYPHFIAEIVPPNETRCPTCGQER